MTISTRMPDGFPNTCPICGAGVFLEPSQPSGDAPCPSCGHLLWFAETPTGPRLFDKGIAESLADILERLGLSRDQFEQALISGTDPKEIGDESLDMVELVLELEERFGVRVEDMDGIHTLAELIDYIQEQKGRQE